MEVSSNSHNYTYRIRGYVDLTKKFILQLVHHSLIPNSSVLQSDLLYREYDDLQKLERCMNKLGGVGIAYGEKNCFPGKKWKLLAEKGTWNIDDMDRSMVKSIYIVDNWLEVVGDCARQLRGMSEEVNKELIFIFDFFDEDKFQSIKELDRQRRAEEVTSKMFQQYFTSEATISLLLNAVTSDYFRTPSCETEATDQLEEILFLEPSCGDGRVLKALGDIYPAVIGCDLDPLIVEVCRAKLNGRCAVLCSDFNRTSRAELMDQYRTHRDRATSIRVINDFEDFSGTSCDPIIATEEKPTSTVASGTPSRIVVVGCPPYTMNTHQPMFHSPDYDPQSLHADLTLQFYRHAAFTLEAESIYFILPRRCNSIDYIARVSEILANNDDVSESSSASMASPCVDLLSSSFEDKKDRLIMLPSTSRNSWCLKTMVDSDCKFELKGRIVSQPSVLQVWTRV